MLQPSDGSSSVKIRPDAALFFGDLLPAAEITCIKVVM